MIDTHYMYRPPALDETEFAAFAADVKKLLKSAPAGIVICGDNGTGKPEASLRRIAFNGDRARGCEHEPLVIEQKYTRQQPSRMRNEVFFDFCKTNGKPYDLVVVAVLYAFIQNFPGCEFVSDSKLGELKPGFELFVENCMPDGNLAELFQRPRRVD